MGNEGQFPIKITGDASSLVAASQQTNQALESNKLKLAELTPEQKANCAALDQTNAASLEAANAATEHTGKLHFLGLKTGELKKLTRELSQEFPIAGMAARMMINPVVAGLTLAVMTFGAAKKALDDWDKRLEESAQRNASRDFLPGIEAKAAALQEGAIAAAAFGQSLAAIGASEDVFTGKVKLAIDKLHEFIAAQAEVNSAGEGKELADVNLKEKLGKLTGIQAIEARGTIKERYRKIADDLKTKGETEELSLKEAELNHSKEQAAALEYDAGKKRRTADELKARLAVSKASLPGAQTSLTDAEKEYAQKQADADKAEDALKSAQRTQQIGTGFGGSYGLQTAQEAFSKAQAEAKTAMQARERQKRLVGSYQQDMREIPEMLLPGAESAAKVAETKATQNVQRIVSLDQETGTLRQTLPIRQAGRQIAGGLKDQTTETETATQIAQELKQGQEKQAQLQQQILSAARSGHGVNAAVLDAFKAQEAHNNAVAKELADYAKRVRDLEGRAPRTY